MSTEHKLKSFRKSLGREFLNWENTFIRLAQVCGGIFLVKGGYGKVQIPGGGWGDHPWVGAPGMYKKRRLNQA